MEGKESLLRLSAVQRRTGLSRTTIYTAIKANAFPQPVSVGIGVHARAVGWLESEIDAWIMERIKASRPDHGA